MSQSRVRKALGGSEGPKRRDSVVRASGDNASGGRIKEQNQNATKNKLPKSLRYELQNALVGLCDVWFENIKPHLVRNNIKVHVDSRSVGPASDDSDLPAGAPGCSHDDPGAASDLSQRQCVNFAASCPTQPTASKAPCRRPRARRPPPGQPPRRPSSPPAQDLTDQSKRILHSKNNSIRNSKKELREPYWDEKITYLCGRHCISTPNGSRKAFTRKSSMKSLDSQLPSRKLPCEKKNFQTAVAVPRSPVKTQNKSSQTENIAIRDYQTNPIWQEVSNFRLEPKEQKSTVTPMTSINLPTKRNSDLPMNKHLVLKHRPTVPQNKHVSIRSTTSKTHTLPLKPQYGTALSEDKCHKAKLREKMPNGQNRLPSENKHGTVNMPVFSHKRIFRHKTLLSTIGPTLPKNKPLSPINRPISAQNVSMPSRSRVMSLQQKRISWHNPSVTPISPLDKLKLSLDKSTFRSTCPLLKRQICLEDRPKPVEARSPSRLSHKVVNHLPLPTSPSRADFGKSPATTSFLRSKDSNEKRASVSLKRNAKAKELANNGDVEIPALFDTELINIIADKNDKRLKLLFLSPKRNETSSTIVNLYSPRESQNKVHSTYKKTKHWK